VVQEPRKVRFGLVAIDSRLQLRPLGQRMSQKIDSDPGDLGLKARLISVAAELLTSPMAVKLPTMRVLAEAAGVSPGAAYRHFRSQDDLFLAVIDSLFQDLEETLGEAANQSKGLRDTVRNVALAYVHWAIENPGRYQLLFEVTDDAELLKRNQRPGLQIIDQIAKMIGSKSRFVPVSIDRVTLLWVALHGLVSLRIHKTGMAWTTTIEQDAEAIMKSLLKP